MREKHFENQIKRRLTSHRYWFFKDFNSGHNTKGIPDIIGCGHGHFFAIEVKKQRGGKPTPVQLMNLAYIAKCGGYAFLAADELVSDLIKFPRTKLLQYAKKHPTKLDVKKLYYRSNMNLHITASQARSFWTKRRSNVIWIVK